MFMGPLEVSKPWNPQGVEGARRFINRVWAFFTNEENIITQKDSTLTKVYHQTVKKVTEDFEQLGFNTAISNAVDMIDCLRYTCESHARLNVVELMGRDCGQCALYAAISSCAVAVAIPEVPFDEAATLEAIKEARANGTRGMIVIVSEGVTVPDENGNPVRYGEILKKKIAEETGVETKFLRMAHMVRGGRPTLRDRLTATEMGVRAVELLLEGKSNRVVIEDNGEITDLDIVFALTTDRMYKNKLKDGDLDKFSEAEIEQMRQICKKRTEEIEYLYKTVCEIRG
jgi:6-phosphofructokinase